MARNKLLEDAADLIAEHLGIDPGLAGLHLHKLKASPLMAVNVVPSLKIARLLISIMASSRPADALPSVLVYEGVPLRLLTCTRQTQAGDRPALCEVWGQPVEYVYQQAREANDELKAHLIETVGQSFPSFLAFLIDAATVKLDAIGRLPESVLISRNLNAPQATLRAPVPNELGTVNVDYVFGLADPEIYARNSQSMNVTAQAPGSIIPALSALVPSQDEFVRELVAGGAA